MMAHKDFIRLLADIEIYVDRVASMQMQNLNAYVDVVRQEIIDRYQPGEDDPHLRILKAAHLDEDEYFQSACQRRYRPVSSGTSAPPTRGTARARRSTRWPRNCGRT